MVLPFYTSLVVGISSTGTLIIPSNVRIKLLRVTQSATASFAVRVSGQSIRDQTNDDYMLSTNNFYFQVSIVDDLSVQNYSGSNSLTVYVWGEYIV